MDELRFEDCMELCDSPAFHYNDESLNDGEDYRIFTNSGASYSEWSRPNALNMVGVTFRLSDKKLVCRPMPKFFELYENPFTEDIDLNECVWVENMVDGIGVHSFLDRNDFTRLKERDTFFSDAVRDASDWLNDRQESFQFVTDLTKRDYTVNLSVMGPKHRQIMSYPKDGLQYINCFHNEAGTYGAMANSLVVKDNFLPSNIENMRDIKGVIYHMKSGQLIKHTTLEYEILANAKYRPSSKHLIEAVLLKTHIKIRDILPNHEGIIQDIETKIVPHYNQMIMACEIFHQDKHNLDRKEYVEEAKKVMPDKLPLLMQLYDGKPLTYRHWYMEHAIV